MNNSDPWSVDKIWGSMLQSCEFKVIGTCFVYKEVLIFLIGGQHNVAGVSCKELPWGVG